VHGGQDQDVVHNSNTLPWLIWTRRKKSNEYYVIDWRFILAITSIFCLGSGTCSASLAASTAFDFANTVFISIFDAYFFAMTTAGIALPACCQ
jgi:ABC-type polysaccharide/polyol phosphate export permease